MSPEYPDHFDDVEVVGPKPHDEDVDVVVPATVDYEPVVVIT